MYNYFDKFLKMVIFVQKNLESYSDKLTYRKTDKIVRHILTPSNIWNKPMRNGRKNLLEQLKEAQNRFYTSNKYKIHHQMFISEMKGV